MPIFITEPKVVGNVDPSLFHWTQIQEEPMFFATSDLHLRINGGPITQAFLAALPECWEPGTMICDTRVHNLHPNWHPSLPGWHLDDIPRSHKNGQPILTNAKYDAEHILMILGGSSLPDFLDGGIELPHPPPECYEENSDSTVYGYLHEQIEEQIRRGTPSFDVARFGSGDLVAYNHHGWHQASPATESGWRFFIRVSRKSGRSLQNARRHQANVFIREVDVGW